MKLSDLELVHNLAYELTKLKKELSELKNRHLRTVHKINKKQKQILKTVFERKYLSAIANIEKQLKELGVEVENE